MKYFLLIVLAAFLLFTAWTAVTQVNTGELAVVRRFGRILDENPKPGLYVGLPWGMDRVDRIKVGKVESVSVGFNSAVEPESRTPAGQLLTGDHNLIDIRAEVQYRVNEEEVAKFLVQKDKAAAIIERATEAALAEWIAAQPVDEVLLRGKAVLPTWLEAAIQRNIKPYELGVSIKSVSVTDLLPPAQVKNAFDAVASDQTLIRTMKNEAEQNANSQLRVADAAIYRIRRDTAAYTSEQLQMARAEAGSFERHVKQYHELREQNPHYLAGLWWNDMSRLYQRMRENGRIDVLDNYLTGNGLNITQMPLLPKK